MPEYVRKEYIRMKNFDDFWNSLTEEDFVSIANSENIAMEDIRNDTTNPRNTLGNQAAILSIHMTKELLCRYHNWLSKQLDLLH